MKKGQSFEQDFKNSVPDFILYYRFRDGTAGWQQGTATRFQQTNACDCLLFAYRTLFFIELKSHKGKSIPFTALRENQISELAKFSRFNNVVTGFIFNFSELEETYFIETYYIQQFIKSGERKSFPVEWVREKGIFINQRKKISRYFYDINTLLLMCTDSMECEDEGGLLN